MDWILQPFSLHAEMGICIDIRAVGSLLGQCSDVSVVR